MHQYRLGCFVKSINSVVSIHWRFWGMPSGLSIRMCKTTFQVGTLFCTWRKTVLGLVVGQCGVGCRTLVLLSHSRGPEFCGVLEPSESLTRVLVLPIPLFLGSAEHFTPYKCSHLWLCHYWFKLLQILSQCWGSTQLKKKNKGSGRVRYVNWTCEDSRNWSLPSLLASLPSQYPSSLPNSVQGDVRGFSHKQLLCINSKQLQLDHCQTHVMLDWLVVQRVLLLS